MNSILQRVLFFSVLFFIPAAIGAQSTFNHLITQPISPYSDLMGLTQTKDSTIYGVISEHSSSYFPQIKGIYCVFATTNNGQLKWLKNFKTNNIQGINDLALNNVQETPDGNLVVSSASVRKTFGFESTGIGLIKMTKQGDLIWSKYIECNNQNSPDYSDMVQVNPATGGFTISGIKGKTENNLFKRFNYCVQLDSNAQLLPGANNQRFFKPNSSYFSIQNTVLDNDNNCYSLGTHQGLGASIVKFPHNASIPAWYKVYTHPTEYVSFSQMVHLDNNRTILTGNSRITSSSGLVAMIDSNGTVIWAKRYEMADKELWFNQSTPASNGVVLSALQGILLKIDTEGNVQWAYDHHVGQAYEAYMISLTNAVDDGYIMSGWSDVVPEFEYGIFQKTDADGIIDKCCNTPANVVVTPYTLNAQNVAYTMTDDSVRVVPWPVTVTDGTWTALSVCAPPEYVFTDTACTGACIVVQLPQLPPGAITSWEAGPSVTIEPFIGTDSVRLCFNGTGAQSVRLHVQLVGGCAPFPYDNAVQIEQSMLPLVFSLSDSLFCPGGCAEIRINGAGSLSLDVPGGTVSGSDSLQVCYIEPGKYPLKATQIQEGCLRSHTIEVTVENLIDETPNAFTPNGDDLNDVFRPLIDCIPDTYSLQIFDRWGNRVYSTDDYLSGWDGLVNGKQAPMDTYIWTVKSNNVQKTYKGDVTLIR